MKRNIGDVVTVKYDDGNKERTIAGFGSKEMGYDYYYHVGYYHVYFNEEDIVL